MLTQVHNRSATNDIDVLLEDIDDPSSPLYHTLKIAIRVVAQQQQLPLSWFNDVVGDALRHNGLIPPGTLWRQYGILVMRKVETLPTTYNAICSGEQPWVALGNFMNEWFDYSIRDRSMLIAEPIDIPMNASVEMVQWAAFCVASTDYV